MFHFLLTLGLLTGLAADLPPCESFEACLRRTLSSNLAVDRAVNASRGIQFFAKGHTQRDLYNLLFKRSEALIQMYESGPKEIFLEQAEADYKRMLEMRPNDYLPQAGLGRIAELRGQLPEAEAFYAQAVSGGDFLAFLERADFLMRRKQSEAALADLDEAWRLAQDWLKLEREIHPLHMIHMHRLRAASFDAQGRTLEATAALKSACGASDKLACKQYRRRERWGPF